MNGQITPKDFEKLCEYIPQFKEVEENVFRIAEFSEFLKKKHDTESDIVIEAITNDFVKKYAENPVNEKILDQVAEESDNPEIAIMKLVTKEFAIREGYENWKILLEDIEAVMNMAQTLRQ